MNKRTFLRILLAGSISGMFFRCTKIRTIIRKLHGRVLNMGKPAQPQEKSPVSFAFGGKTVSVETTLNSRCTSDSDGHPFFSHWGMFSAVGTLPIDKVKELVSLATIPRLTSTKIGIQISDHTLSFEVDNRVHGSDRVAMMIESGMQQQALALASAALGVGNRIQNRGINGSPGQFETLQTVLIRVEAMNPSYNGAFWSSEPPSGEAPWLLGNLPDPIRSGSVPLLSALKTAVIKRDGESASIITLGQLLWSCRGRTPHFYKSIPWGMTIPTWAGTPCTSVSVFTSAKKYSYVNIKRGRPTHSLVHDRKNTADCSVWQKMFPDWNCFILLSQNESSGRSLWEIGYQIENMLLQACSFNFGYSLHILSDNEKNLCYDLVRDEPIAVLALNMNDELS